MASLSKQFVIWALCGLKMGTEHVILMPLCE